MNAQQHSSSRSITSVDGIVQQLGDSLLDVVGGDRSDLLCDVVTDSREVVQGSLFCCIRGERFDGHGFAHDAVQRGATALLLEEVQRDIGDGVVQIVVRDVRSILGSLSANFYGNPSWDMTVVGITGTNGKTTTAHLLASILQASGRSCEIIGTLQGKFTTPEAPQLQKMFAEMRERKIESVSMEVSSHALSYGRVAGTRFAAAAFTNLGRDHLDFHGTMDDYFEAKALLFEPEYSKVGIINGDDDYGKVLMDRTRIPMVAFFRSDAKNVRFSVFDHDYEWNGHHIHVDMGGSLNVMNSLAAATVARELGVSNEQIVQGLSESGQVPGRFERIDEGQDFTVIVDFAHTPDGLSEVLRSIRSIPDVARVIIVFGCGGDRDKMKRPMMGEVAASLADVVIVTSDNPRSEDPEAIIASIVAGIPDHMRHRLWSTPPDRAEAISAALGMARAGDVVLVTGKGHETTQTIGTEVLPFDDRTVVRDLLRSSR